MPEDSNNPFAIRVEGGKIRDRKVISQDKFSSDEGFIMLDDNSSVQMGPVIENRYLRFAIIFIFIVFTILSGRIFFLQIIQGDIYKGLAEGNRIRLQSINPNRGIIYDRYGEQLVRNVPSFTLQFVPSDLPSEEELTGILNEIAIVTNSDFNNIFEIIKNREDYSYLAVDLVENISYQNAIDLRIQSADWAGIQVVEEAKREYLLGDSFSHLLGYMGKITEGEYKNLSDNYRLNDELGKVGIEYEYEAQLRGIVGKKQIEVDALGKENKIIAEQKADTGDNVYLHIDAKLQIELARAIDEKMKAGKTSKAAAIIMNPKNGGILSMISYPNYNNNVFLNKLSVDEYNVLFENEDRPLFNRAISGQYPSGSIIKPLVSAAALEEKVIDRSTSFNSTGGIYYDIWFFPDWKAGGHGQTNVVKALAESVNTFYYMIGIEEYDNFSGLGLDRMLQYMDSFGLGRKLGVDISGEVSGFLPDRYWKWEERNEPWYPGDTMHLAIGQGDILVTPLQMVNYISAIANGGTLYRPQLLQKRILSDEDEIIMSTPEVLNEDFIASENLAIVREGMRAAVTSGSARFINSTRYKAAGKTGTAQVGGNSTPHSWFVGFAPYEDPEIAWAILVENGGEGSETAVPIMRDVLDWYFRSESQN
jgi:penicillin-binding protein 2